jgi:enamine deaminase RidA (YjgF/YER057c/UK114 family)
MSDYQKSNTTSIHILQPSAWTRPRGYAHGVAAQGKQIFISGQIGWNEQGNFEAPDFVGQAKQALQNIVTILAEANGKPEHIVRLTWYVIDREEYRARSKELGEAYRALMGTHYPAMSVVQVAGLVEEQAWVEIEATAVVPSQSIEAGEVEAMPVQNAEIGAAEAVPAQSAEHG